MAIKYLNVIISSKKATYLTRYGDIVCGNSDYRVRFHFDSEWDGHNAKVARFIWNGHFVDVEFSGNEVDVPVISGATEVKVGVHTTDDGPYTTTAAVIPCTPSILCEGGTVWTPSDQPGGGSVEVVQETGSSTSAVMSQKATTDELGKKVTILTNREGMPCLYQQSTTGAVSLRPLQNLQVNDETQLIAYSAVQRDGGGRVQTAAPYRGIDAVNRDYLETIVAGLQAQIDELKAKH
jgi:hypothetical protein